MIFSKDKRVKNKDKITKKKYGYKVTLCDPLGESPREIDTFGANKTRNNDGVVMLTNESKKFSEIFPLDSDYTVEDTIEDIEAEIVELKKTKRGKNENKLNKAEKLYKLQKQKKALENPKGSFLKIDKDGMPHLIYIRYRAAFVPMKWNLDFGTIHTPVEPLIRNVLTKQEEKRAKYRQDGQTILTMALAIFFMINLIWSGVLAYTNVKTFDAYDNSNIAKLQNRIDSTPLYCAEQYGLAGHNFVLASENVLNLTGELRETYSPQVNLGIESKQVK